MTKLDLINSCLEYSGQRPVTTYNGTIPEQLLANDFVEKTTYEITTIIYNFNPTLLGGIGITNDFDSIIALPNIEAVLNHIKAKVVRNFTNAKITSEAINKFTNEELIENTLSFIQFMINIGIPENYTNSVISGLEDLGLITFDTSNTYVNERSKLDYRIDLYLAFGVSNGIKDTELKVITDKVKALFNSVVAKTIDNGPSVEMINNMVSELCAKGWYFNTSKNWEFVPDTLGFIGLSSSILRFDNKYGYIKKSGKVYDPKKGTFNFETNIYADIVVLVDYQDLPEIVKTYIDMATNIRFINLLSSKLGKDKYRGLIQRYTKEEVKEAYLDIRRENARTAKLNIFNDYTTRRILEKTSIPRPIVNGV